MCGRRADGQVRRMGETFCSEAHADEFGQAVRALTEARGDRDGTEGMSSS